MGSPVCELVRGAALMPIKRCKYGAYLRRTLAGKVVRDVTGSRAVQPFVGKWHLFAVHRTELPTEAIELLADHLTMAQTAHEQVHQHAAVQGPGAQRTVRVVRFQGGDSTARAAKRVRRGLPLWQNVADYVG